MGESKQQLQAFLEEWVDTDERNKESFLRLKTVLEGKAGVEFAFIPRAGVTYSLRASHPNQKDRSLFVMVDVIEDDPRWLSVCFYNDMIEDPEERGDFVPQGLLGEDAACFDLESYSEVELQYVEARLEDAYQQAVR